MQKYGSRLFVIVFLLFAGLGLTNERPAEFKTDVPEFSVFNSETEIKDFAQHLTKAQANSGPRIMPNGVSVPGDFPHIDVTINQETADGYIFINNWSDQSPYNIVFDNDGSPVWYERQAPGDRRRDFKVQKNGSITMLTRTWPPRYIGYDENFNPIKEYVAADPYFADEHELQVLENGNYLIIGIRDTTVDWSERVPGGNSQVTVLESAIQEFTPDGELIFTWAGLDHFDPNDIYDYCTLNEANPKGTFIRFPHMNAIDIDDDGHILLSSRHISEVTKIHRETGEIIWRLGGANNQFEFVTSGCSAIIITRFLITAICMIRNNRAPLNMYSTQTA